MGVLALIVLANCGPGRAAEIAASYGATWAGLPAGAVRMGFRRSGDDYRDEIEIVTTGLAHLLTKFKADAFAEGRWASEGTAMPSQYDARYDLRKRRDSRVDLRFVARGAAVIAERGAADTSRKPPLAESFRRNALDPLSALAAVRHELQLHPAAARSFTVPVFDGARRFDVIVTAVSSDTQDHLIRLRLTLRPIAGFKGESSEDGDPDSAPRIVELALTDDAALVPVSFRTSIAFFPLVIRLDHLCDSFAACGAR
jgi:hypothetical protein